MTSPSISGYSALGWHVFPCHSIINGACSCGNLDCDSPGKHPRTHNGVKGASSNLQQLEAWYKQFPGANWALATGQISGVFAVDIDERKGGFESFDEYEQNRTAAGDFGNTLIAKTGGGGRHILLAPPEGHHVGNRVNWRPGVDIRGDGGYIILPRGNHISGGFYEWINWGTKVMAAPEDFLLDIHASGGNSDFDSSVIKNLTADQFIEGIEEGARDDTIFRMACKLRRQLGDNRAAVSALVLLAAANSNPPFPEKDALRKVDQAFRQDHSDLQAEIFVSGDANERPLSHLTDMGNRDRFLDTFADDYRYVVGIGWHKWADDGWHVVDKLTPNRDAQQVPAMIRDEAKGIADLQMRQKFTNWASISESAGKVAAIITMAEGHERIKRSVDDFDNDPYLLASANGMIDLRDGSIRRFTRDDLFTRNTRIVYDENFALPRWEEFIKTVTDGDDEVARYLQMAAGYSLTGLITEESFFVVSGLPQTGKSTFLSAIESCMGSYADVASAEVFMKRYGKEAPREELVKFAGSRMITVEEIPEGERFDDALLKRITGGTRLSARYLYQEAFTYVPQFKIWFATNYDPITSDSGMYRRLKRVTFNNRIPEEKKDRGLKNLLMDRSVGGRAILAWAVKGAAMYIDEGKLTTPLSVQAATLDYQKEQDSFAYFMNETFTATDPSIQARIAESHIYDLHVDWSKRNSERPMKRPQFAQKLRERGFQLIVDDATQTRYVPNLSVRVAEIFNR
uniref:DNA primase n=1 Tax=Micrococcus phage Kurnik TaxID=3092208 RepID=A0AAU6R693_9CAUD